MPEWGAWIPSFARVLLQKFVETADVGTLTSSVMSVEHFNFYHRASFIEKVLELELTRLSSKCTVCEEFNFGPRIFCGPVATP